MKTSAGESLRVVVFCGGRGSATLIRELLRWPHIQLSLLVNAYDDGLSTGALRDFIPGMLGPSDFRKNLSYLVDPHSPTQYSLQRLLEYRMPLGAVNGLNAVKRFAETADASGLPEELGAVLRQLDAGLNEEVRRLLQPFCSYAAGRDVELDFSDVSFGNLLFAGAYLRGSEHFNAAVYELARLFRSQASLINVSRGECRSLVALKEDGELLFNEAQIVGKQSAVPIREVFFLERPPRPEEWAAVAERDLDAKVEWLHARQIEVGLSAEAEAALESAQIVVYGPGTQHSSLLPSYRIAGAAIHRSEALVRAFVTNLQHDFDIQGLTAEELVDRALYYLDDPANEQRSITHVIYSLPDANAVDAIALNGTTAGSGAYRGATIVRGDFANPSNRGVHSGHKVVRAVLEVFDRGGAPRSDRIDVFVDLFSRSLAVDSLVQEFLELDWEARFSGVRLRVNASDLPKTATREGLTIESATQASVFSEVQTLREWLERGDTEYLATVTGDGEYRLRDVFLGTHVLDAANFGVVHGSRTQSRRQFQTSLRAAYGEGGLLYRLSWLGAFTLTALFGLRFGVIFSDPLTGFRVYKRSRLRGRFQDALRTHRASTAASVTRLLISSGIEIAEIPVTYRTFAGFTNPRWRLRRGFKNLFGMFG